MAAMKQLDMVVIDSIYCLPQGKTWPDKIT